MGGTIKAKLQRADLERLLSDGFLPAVSSSEMPTRRRVGLQEIGSAALAHGTDLAKVCLLLALEKLGSNLRLTE